jgi:hypothetical protein
MGIKEKTDFDYCLKHAVNPPACTGKHKDYSPPLRMSAVKNDPMTIIKIKEEK